MKELVPHEGILSAPLRLSLVPKASLAKAQGKVNLSLCHRHGRCVVLFHWIRFERQTRLRMGFDRKSFFEFVEKELSANPDTVTQVWRDMPKKHIRRPPKKKPELEVALLDPSQKKPELEVALLEVFRTQAGVCLGFRPLGGTRKSAFVRPGNDCSMHCMYDMGQS